MNDVCSRMHDIFYSDNLNNRLFVKKFVNAYLNVYDIKIQLFLRVHFATIAERRTTITILRAHRLRGPFF